MPKAADPTLAQLRVIADTVEVVDAHEFRRRGAICDARRAPAPQGKRARRGGSPLQAALQDALYRHEYCGLPDHPGGDSEPRSTADESDDGLVDVLEAANQSRTMWDFGWRVLARREGGQVIAGKDNRARRWQPGQYVHDDKPAAPNRHDLIRGLAMRGSVDAQPGFYFVFGEAIADDVDRSTQARFYWNIGWAGAGLLARELSRQLNRWRIPFQFKCARSKRHFARRDSAVLYVACRRLPMIGELLGDIHSRAAGALSPETPLFSRRIADGLSVAEDPGDGESFGMGRCRIVSEGLLRSFEEGRQTPSGRFDAIVEQFATRGVSLERPWLRRGDQDPFGVAEFEL